MADIVQNTGYVSEGLGRLLEQYKNKPRIAGLLTAYLNECQAVENALYAVLIDRLIQNSPTGDLLDKIGEIVGQARNGQNDADYLLFIRARIATNTSQGRISDLLNIATLILTADGSPTPIYEQDLSPASVLIIPQTAISVAEATTLLTFLSEAVLAGVKLILIWLPQPLSSTLIFGSVYGFTPTTAQSPGSVYTGGTGGGDFAGVLEA